MNIQYFKLTDIILGIESEKPTIISPETEPFVITAPGHVDGTITVSHATDFEQIPLSGHWAWNRLYDGNTVRIFDAILKKQYAQVTYLSRQEIQISCLKGYNCFHTSIMLNLLGLEQLLLWFDAMMLHASFVRHKGKGILFSAPSGTGKSTQADLWEKHCGAEIINGDRVGLRKLEGQWHAYGLPFAGSSGIYRNESAPIGAIVVLEQGGENELLRLSAGEAFRALFPEISIQRWNENFVSKVMDLLSDLLSVVPVYRLICRPDEEAVRLLEGELKW